MRKLQFLLIGILVLGSAFYFIQKQQPKTYEEISVRPSHVDDRQWYRIQQRGGKIEPEKIVKGRQRVEKLLSLRKEKRSNYKDGGLRFWNDRGPGNIGGRVRAIYIRQNDFVGFADKLIIGAAGGGIFISTDDGTTWSAVNDFLPSLAVTSFAGDGSTIYASTGEGQAASTIGLPGAGIYKSTNGGSSWTQLSSTANSDFYWVNKVAINPDNANHLLAVTSMLDKDGVSPGGGKLKESINGGASWTDVLTTTTFLTDVEFHPDNGDIRVVSGHGQLYVYNSTTNIYESKITNVGNYNGRIEVALAPSDEDYVYAQINSLVEASPQLRYRSTNGGATWTFIGGTPEVFGVNLGNYANTVWVDPLDKTNVYFGGLDMWRSTDSGSTITKISDWKIYHENGTQLHADQHIIYPSPTYSISDRSVYFGNDGGIQKSDNITTASAGGIGPAGYTNLANSTLGITQFYSASASPINDAIGGGTQDNSFITQAPSGGDWFQHNTGDGSMLVFHPTDPNIIYANTNHNSLWKSTDGGATYTIIDTLGKNLAQLISPIAINPVNPNKIYMGGLGLWEYNESTLSKTQINPGFLGCSSCYVTTIAVHPDGNQIYIGYNTGSVQYTSDGGSNWFSVGAAIPKAVTDIAINNNPPSGTSREAIFTFGGYSQNNVIKYSLSNFPQWDNISLDFDMQVNTVTYHPQRKDWIYIGTDVGIFASEDKGENWSVTPIHDGASVAYDNEGPIYTEVSELFWDSIGIFQEWSLHAATFGRGIWFSNLVLDTIHVDLGFTGGFELGTRLRPFNTFNEGLEAAENTGAVLNILGSATYDEVPTIINANKRVLITSSANSKSVVE